MEWTREVATWVVLMGGALAALRQWVVNPLVEIISGLRSPWFWRSAFLGSFLFWLLVAKLKDDLAAAHSWLWWLF